MALRGHGAVTIWNDVAPEGLAEFYEWHHREHMPERVSIPGFLRGRRYAAVRGAPEFFTLYEATGTDVLAGPHYLERLNNPTPLTRHVIPKYFRNMVRGVCDVRFSAGVGDGGWLITLRFAAEAEREHQLSRHLMEVLPAINEMPTILGAHLCVADARASTIETSERKSHGAAVPQWLVMIEGATPDGADAACDRLLARELMQHGAKAQMERGLYALQISLTSSPASSSA
ncbi:MAG: hypothetical protein V7608_4148 [Hyphomicrobiales bacterium]|jgi:hypothetical protein